MFMNISRKTNTVPGSHRMRTSVVAALSLKLIMREFFLPQPFREGKRSYRGARAVAARQNMLPSKFDK